nr:hypothetical protein [Tanacetum cinerariifolium]
PATAQIVFDALGQQSAYLRHEYPVRIDDKFKPGENPNPDDAPAAKLPDKLKGVDSVTVQFAAALDPATDDLLDAVLDNAGCYHLLPNLYHAYLTDRLAVIDPVAAAELHRTGLSERLSLSYIDLGEFQAAFNQENITDYYTPGDAARLLLHL